MNVDQILEALLGTKESFESALGRIPSSPWWNHDFLSDKICIGDSGDFDDG
jgi:hypothetical protein